MRRVLIAGCGYVGTALASKLVEDGNMVWGLRRSDAELPAGVDRITADLASPIAPLPSDLDVVVYCASAGASSPEAYERAYSCGVRNCLAALADGGAQLKRFIFVSSTGVFGEANGGWVDEATAAEPRSETGKILLQAEEQVHNSLGNRATIVRFGGIYGPRRTRLLTRLRQSRRESQPALPIQYGNRIHQADCAAILAHILALSDPAPLYLGVDNEPASRQTVLDWLATEDLQLPEPDEPHSPRPSRHSSNKRCASALLVASGYRFIFPTFRQGYRSLINE